MNLKNWGLVLSMAAWAIFAIAATAQRSGEGPQSDASQPSASGMSPDMMAQHHKMMTQHAEMGSLIDRLVKEFSAIENEKDPALLKKRMEEYRGLLKDLQMKFQQGSGMMGPMGQSAVTMQHAEQAMGFSQTATTHHFFLRADGGVIQVEANDPKDTQNRELIRAHLTHIAHAFSAGDFSDPMAVHDKVPDGVPVMQSLKGEIRYIFEQTPQGGRVLIETAKPEALDAIHAFLRFQIREHQTGDTLDVQ